MELQKSHSRTSDVRHTAHTVQSEIPTATYNEGHVERQKHMADSNVGFSLAWESVISPKQARTTQLSQDDLYRQPVTHDNSSASNRQCEENLRERNFNQCNTKSR